MCCSDCERWGAEGERPAISVGLVNGYDPEMASAHFRACAVAVIARADGRILAFERTDHPGTWQLPQGGLEPGESWETGAWRELGEETGLGPDEVRLVGEHPRTVCYEFPEALRMQRPDRLGQATRWFFFEPRIDPLIPRPDHVEFKDWRWFEGADLIDQVVQFKRDAYVEVLG
jgi:putative (di)nucleoside polyphosphate hydrolase